MLRRDRVLCSVSGSAAPDRAGGHQAVGGDQSGVLGRVCQVRWEVGRYSATPPPTASTPRTFTSSPSDVPGDGVRDFFFRVASLTFEAIVLSELENSGSKHASDIVSESDS